MDEKCLCRTLRKHVADKFGLLKNQPNTIGLITVNAQTIEPVFNGNIKLTDFSDAQRIDCHNDNIKEKKNYLNFL